MVEQFSWHKGVRLLRMNENDTEHLIFSKIQVIMAEKRTSLATLRTAIALLILPLSVLSVLIATSKFYDTIQVMHLLVPLLIISAGLILIGFYLIIRAIIQIRRHDRHVKALKEKYNFIKEIIED